MEPADLALRAQHQVERRTFMAMLTGGLLAAPLAAEGQQAGKVYRLEYLGVRRPTTAQALVQRARVILECTAGKTNTRVARELRLTKQTVGNWHSRFLAARLGGLLDEPRPGARRKIGDGEVDRVVTLTLEGTPHDATHWSTRAMATRSDLRLTRLALG